jgi:t-SNARE complex subunit (syntaxin)
MLMMGGWLWLLVEVVPRAELGWMEVEKAVDWIGVSRMLQWLLLLLLLLSVLVPVMVVVVAVVLLVDSSLPVVVFFETM